MYQPFYKTMVSDVYFLFRCQIWICSHLNFTCYYCFIARTHAYFVFKSPFCAISILEVNCILQTKYQICWSQLNLMLCLVHLFESAFVATKTESQVLMQHRKLMQHFARVQLWPRLKVKNEGLFSTCVQLMENPHKNPPPPPH